MKTLLCLLLLAALPLCAADLTGKWTGKFDITTTEGEEKPDQAVMNLKLDGGAVTGTAGPNDDQQWPILKGKLEGNKLTFEVVPEGDADKGLLQFELVFDGDTIKGAAKMQQGDEKMSAKVDLKRAG
jgi:hypothetical protein